MKCNTIRVEKQRQELVRNSELAYKKNILLRRRVDRRSDRWFVALPYKIYVPYVHTYVQYVRITVCIRIIP
jgi:hypothetical protein